MAGLSLQAVFASHAHWKGFGFYLCSPVLSCAQNLTDEGEEVESFFVSVLVVAVVVVAVAVVVAAVVVAAVVVPVVVVAAVADTYGSLQRHACAVSYPQSYHPVLAQNSSFCLHLVSWVMLAPHLKHWKMALPPLTSEYSDL